MATLEEEAMIAQGRTPEFMKSYMEHMMNVMQLCNTDRTATPLEIVVARYHDAVEDGVFTLDEIKYMMKQYCEFTPTQIEEAATAILAITRNSNETYAEYIERVKKNPTARCVKIFDIMANLFMRPTPPKHSLKMRYEKALQTLSDYTHE